MRTGLNVTVLILLGTAAAAAGEQPVQAELERLRAEAAEVETLVSELRAELSEVKAALNTAASLAFGRWKAERQAFEHERRMLDRERLRLENERARVDELAEFHRDRRAPPPQPGGPVALSGPDDPRYAPRPSGVYSPPSGGYIPGFSFFSVGHPCLGLAPIPLIYRDFGPVVRLRVHIRD